MNGLVQNVFGEWVSPFEAGPPPCVSIPITDELRAEDEAARMARENVAPDWKIKESLSPENLRLMRHRVGPNRMPQAPGQQRIAVQQPKRVVAPEPPESRMTERKPTRKLCKCKPDCNLEFEAAGNAQLYAPGHRPVVNGTPQAKIAKVKPRAVAAEPKPETVSINVPITALDNFWLRLTTETKVRAVERFLAGELS